MYLCSSTIRTNRLDRWYEICSNAKDRKFWEGSSIEHFFTASEFKIPKILCFLRFAVSPFKIFASFWLFSRYVLNLLTKKSCSQVANNFFLGNLLRKNEKLALKNTKLIFPWAISRIKMKKFEGEWKNRIGNGRIIFLLAVFRKKKSKSNHKWQNNSFLAIFRVRMKQLS